MTNGLMEVADEMLDVANSNEKIQQNLRMQIVSECQWHSGATVYGSGS